MTDITVERASIEARIDDLRRKRGAAAANGRDRLSSDIAALKLQLDVLDDVEAARVRTARDDAEVERLKQEAELKAELETNMACYLEDVAEAERSARACAAAIGRLLQTTSTMLRVAHQL